MTEAESPDGSMTYALHRLAPGSYDLVLGGEVVGSVVREVRGAAGDDLWHAELLDDPVPEKRPPPFSRVDHTFGSLPAVMAWLGDAGGNGNKRSVQTNTSAVNY